MMRVYILAVWAVSIVAMVSCDFKDPLVDRDGENITLVRLDLPKFDARYTIRLLDIEGNPMGNATAELDFIGRDALNLITDAGQMVMKENSTTYLNYRTAKYGILGLNLNPNFKVSSHPVEFQVNGSEMGMEEYVVLPRLVKQTVAGDLCADVIALKQPIKPDDQANQRLGNLLTQGEDDAEIVTPLSGHIGNGYNMIALYRSTEAQSTLFSCVNNMAGYDNIGIYLLKDDMRMAPGKTKVVGAEQYFILVGRQSNLIEGRINVEVKSELAGVATSFPYTITTEEGEVINRGAICGTLPFSSTIEQIFVAEASQVYLNIENSTTCAIVADHLQTIHISATSTATIPYSVVINDEFSDNLRRSEISVVGICNTNKQIAFHPTIRFQYSLKDSSLWEWAESRGGKIVMMLEQGEDYTIRMPINNTWQSFGITTNQDKINGIVRDQPNVSKFELINNTDGSMNLKVEYRDQEFCDLTL